jgi:hypothetical protein
MTEAELPRVVLDSCVLYPPGLRNLFMWLAVEEAYVPKWTDDIHEEWIRNVLEDDARKNDPPRLTRANLERTRQLMDRSASRSLVTGYQKWIPTLSLPDDGDRHVLAAAVESESDAIVTFNLRHFPSAALESYGIEAVSPDDFLSELYDADPALFRSALEKLRLSLKNPPMTDEELLHGYGKLGLKNLVRRLQAE